MASREDIPISWHLSPRLLFVDAPSTELTIQDLHDTAHDKEQEMANIIYPNLISSAGKENLGGGVFVGLTSTMQNARVGFQTRKVWVSTGSITTTDASSLPDGYGKVLKDSNATFVADGVKPGAWVVNTTDGSICTALTIDSEIQITTDNLGGGSDNIFTSGDLYRLMNIVQVEVAGGNLVGVDGYGVNIDPIFPTAGVQVVRTSASSATTQSQSQLEHSTFNGVVTIDISSNNTGLVFPIGTQQTPVNNFSDARAIALSRGFDTLRVIGNATLGLGDDVSNLVVIGDNASKTKLIVLDAAETTNVEIQDATVTGVFDDAADFVRCHLIDIQFVKANIHSCQLEGEITLSGTGLTALYNCNDGLVAGAPPPSINFNGSGRSLAIRNYFGDIEFTNKTGTENVEFNMVSGGQLLINSSVTGGNIRLTGIMDVIDNSVGATIDTSDVIFPDQVQLAAFNGQVTLDVINGAVGTKYPLGLKSSPTNNFVDAQSIASSRGLTEIFILGSMTVGSANVIDGLTLIGENRNLSKLSITNGASTINSTFQNCSLDGYISGAISVINCEILNLFGLGSSLKDSVFDTCGLDGTLVLGTSGKVNLINCYSDVADGSVNQTPTIDYDGYSHDVILRNYTGGLKVINSTASHFTTMDIISGQLEFDLSVTNGNFTLRGNANLTDNSSGSALLDTSNLIFPDELQLSAFNGHIFISSVEGVSGTKFPIGTHGTPSNNLIDAKSIALNRGLSSLEIDGYLIIGATESLSEHLIIGDNPSTASLFLTPGCTTVNTQFERINVQGKLNGTTTFENCILNGNLELGGSAKFGFINCFDGSVEEINTPVIDYGGSGNDLIMRGYSGGLILRNSIGNQTTFIDVESGKITLQNTISDGYITLRGQSNIIDNSTGTSVIDTTQLIYPNELQLSAFERHIFIDAVNGEAGVKFPIGTHARPVNNLIDAKLIGGQYNIITFLINGTFVIGSSDDISGLTFIGDNALTSVMILTSGCITDRSTFDTMIIAGTVNGSVLLVNCGLQNVAGLGADTFPTVIDRSIFRPGTQTMRAGLVTPQNVHFLDCKSGVPGSNTPILDMNGSTASVAFRSYSGGLNVRNFTGGQDSTFGYNDGYLTFDASCTSGSASIHGMVLLTDNSAAGFIVSNQAHISANFVSENVWNKPLSEHVDTTTFGGWVGSKLLSVTKFLGLSK